MKKLFFVLFLLWGCFSGYSQVGIGIKDPSPSAMLDIYSARGNKGVLMPKVELQDKQSYAPILGDANDTHNIGLIVYNTTINVAKELTPGYYYWTGKAWTKMADVDTIMDLIGKPSMNEGGVYYGKINGGTKEVLYFKKKEANGTVVDVEIDLVSTLLNDFANLSEENIFNLRKVFGYDITERVVFTGKKVQGKYHYSVYGRTEIDEGNAEVRGLRLNSGSLQLLEDGVIFKIHLLNQQQQIVDVGITDIEVTTGGMLKFSLGSSSVYYTLPAGQYGVIVEFLSTRELL